MMPSTQHACCMSRQTSTSHEGRVVVEILQQQVSCSAAVSAAFCVVMRNLLRLSACLM